MANAFDRANYAETEPERLVIGDRWLWKRTDIGTDYPVASYAVSYEFRRDDQPNVGFTISATEVDPDYVVEVADTTTIAYEPGVYRWSLFVTRSSDSERLRLEHGWTDIQPDPSTSDVDQRTHAQQMRDALEALELGAATRDQLAYSIGGRSLSRLSPEQRRQWLSHYRHLAAQDERADRIRNGRGSGLKVRMRLH